ncbi:ROK family protein [Pedobacter mendelii]|uniref:Transcriptional regulator n=1 Tax=Pedobacter mendelii TaxID=1908240 RepID=A0ABQ2BLL1_9SPHI|nr:ROK family protein [Pedobacter mendelii]GGI27505.1 transcriptional regulator [Pedobacter mendelii]
MSATVKKSELLKADVIKHLYYKNVLSLTDLSRLTQKSLPLVTSIVNGLIKEGQIIEQGFAPSTGGRRAVMFLINPEYKKYIVAVAMDQFITRLTIYDLSNNKILPTQLVDLNMSAEDSADLLIEFINNCIAKSNIDRENLLGVGIGMPGFVNAEKGMNYSFMPIEDGNSLQGYLVEKLNLPIFLDNDSSLIALAELHFGEAAGLKDVLVVNVGWGTGLGMIVNGNLYRGSSGYAGEFSHIPLSNSDTLCSCGKRGCLEVETSLLIMVEKAEKAVNAGEPTIMAELFEDKTKHHADHFLDAVVKQDSVAISILFDAAFQIGKGLATLIHIMNPERIVLSGRGAKAGKMLLPPIQQAINKFCIPRVAEQTSIVLSNLAEQAELLAAASLVVEHSNFD